MKHQYINSSVPRSIMNITAKPQSLNWGKKTCNLIRVNNSAFGKIENWQIGNTD